VLSAYRPDSTKVAVDTWNTNLRQAIEVFCSEHEDATIFLFSSYEAFNVMLDDLEKYGMEPTDARKQGGSVWVDHIHPTSKVHDHIGRSVAQFLEGITPA